MTRTLSSNTDLGLYMAEVNRHALLTQEQEKALAESYRETCDIKIAQQLVTANLRFVVKICHEYRGYGLEMSDLVQEGSLGLMQAVRKFDPSKGFRLISYAVWWIRAFIQNYIQHSWSLVKLGTTQAQRKLFYKLRRAREAADREAGVDAPAGLDVLARQFGLTEHDISSMESRLSWRDVSLDAEIVPGEGYTVMDTLHSVAASPEELASESEARQIVARAAARAFDNLNERERYILERRLLAPASLTTLREIGAHFEISRERVRQIEGNVRHKIYKIIRDPRAALLS